MGSKHAAPDLKNDIQVLMKYLHERKVYTFERGRSIDGEKAVAINALQIGMKNLPGPLAEYNSTFKRMQERHRVMSLLSCTQSEASEAAPSMDTTRTHAEVPSQFIARPESPPWDIEFNSDDGSRSLSSSEDDASEDSGSISDSSTESSDSDQAAVGWDSDELLTRETEEDVALDMD
ncbi:hypothetical protein NLI96_g7980 [Meripilus lineatus]|uniref:Uncharacterized protein n=1 Tax=Meripilus lineatus TaxID=2056292 RepID=A0AAD5YBI8_9APHY|nr:hypothetical protein NLI96_g7980 [Physisporinus lineatus]